jgi:hypothetical protein
METFDACHQLKACVATIYCVSFRILLHGCNILSDFPLMLPEI